MSHLEENARLSHELERVSDELAVVTAQRDELKVDLEKKKAENLELRKDCQRFKERSEVNS